MPGLTMQPPSGKQNQFGIEVVHGLTWQGWEPGREYTKHIILKNVRVKTQKLKYKVPQSRFFTTLYPQPIVLSAGTSFTLPVTFRPLEKHVYQDKIEFATNEGDFSVPIRAILPVYNIEVPEHIKFNMCAAQDFVQLSFEIKNVSELETPFRMEGLDPFIIEPAEGVLSPFGTATLTATFKPKAAVVYEVEAICNYGQGLSHAKVTKFEGIGKYPHLLVSSMTSTEGIPQGDNEAVVNFGCVAVGQKVEKWIKLTNNSPVNAPFQVQHPSEQNRIDTVFTCKQRHGVVPALSTLEVPICYSPKLLDATSIDYFSVIAIGNISKTIVKCVGKSKGPKVELSSKSINFGQVDSGRSSTRTVDIVNLSDTEATFQFQIDCSESVFKFEHISGTLPAGTKKTIILQFEPTHPINYYRRVSCLIHNQGPLFLDLLGTCHTETGKPAVLQSKHVERYRAHVQRGFSVFPPEQLNDMLKEGKLQTDDKGAIINKQAEAMEPLCSPLKEPSSMEEYFNDGYHSEMMSSPPHVSTDIHQVNFGQCSDLRIIEQQVVNMTNHTKGKITVVWTGDASHVFSVSPVTTDIPPQASAAFTVTFRPQAPNQFYGAELECYAYYKSMRDYRLVEDITHSPPWCLTVTATGQTFMPNNETFLPRYNLDTKKVVFPAVNANEATYRTICLSNLGPTPILYDFEKEDTGIYSIKPTKGLLTQGHQIFVVKAQPKEVKTYKKPLKLKMNDAEKHTQDVLMWGSAEAAEVLLDNTGVMYFKPTCVGTSSQRMFSVKNVSRIPLKFEWKMNHEDDQLLSVTPSSGVIQPNESQFHTWSFTPNEHRKFVMKPALVVWGQGQSSSSSGGKKRQFPVRVIGEGSVGEIKAEKLYIDYGTVVVGSSASQHITLTNQSDCSLHYKLIVEQSVSGPGSEDRVHDEYTALELDKTFGILPARSKQVINAKVRPVRRLYYQFSISYQLITPDGNGVNPVAQDTHHLCHILTTGVYPTMAVTDARCYGSAIGLSKKQLWNLFALDSLNSSLDADPAETEVMYSVATRHSHNRRPSVYTRAIQDFNFSAAPVNSEPCVVQLMVENPGPVPTEWAFLFPSDLQLELQYWAETGEYDLGELHEMKVIDNKLFTVEPKKGVLEPGECKTITLQYNHFMAGTDRLPVLLKIAEGREILLNFVGVSVEPGRPYVHFPSNKFMFSPVPVGQKNSPTQVYEMYNGGATPLNYQIDTAPLAALTKDNFDHPVFECLKPKGEILPGRTLAVEWRFSPLEAKTYSVDIPIHIHNGDTALVTFTGIGYDQRVMGDTMPITDKIESSSVPNVQTVAVPGQDFSLAFLSQERVSFGNMPLFCKVRRLVTLSNRSRQTSLSFRWHVTTKEDTQYVRISPAQGTLRANSGVLCNIIFTSCGVPSFYDLDLVCEVIDDSKMSVYQHKLQLWESEKQRQKVEFTITENDIDADKRLPDIEGRPKSGELRPIEKTIKDPQDEAKYAKYKTLPPIRQTTVDDQCDRQKRIQARKDEYWQKPVPPDPFLLHLGVTARTHDIIDFQNNFPNEYKNFYIDRSLSEKFGPKIRRAQAEQEAEEEQSIPCVEAEADIIAGALANVLRGLLDDSNFHESINKITEEPVPYYNQFANAAARHPKIHPKESDIQESDLPSVPRTPAPSKEDVDSKDRSPDEGRAGSVRSTRSVQLDLALQEEDFAQLVDEQGTSSQLISASRASSVDETSSRCSSSSSHGPETEQMDEEQTEQHIQKQAMKKTPEFGRVAETLIDNTLMNIIQEAFLEEFNITARPRQVAMLPRPATPKSGRNSKKL